MTDQNLYNNNISLLPLKTDIININQLSNNTAVPPNNYNNLSPYIDTNLNLNNLVYLNSNNSNVSNINLNNQIQQEVKTFPINSKNIYNSVQNNNYFNNMNNKYYQSGNINKLIKPCLSSINMLLISPSLTKATDLIYKDLQQIENILTNYKYYIMTNNYEAINVCLKYILEANFFFNQVVTKKIGDIFNIIIFSNNNNDEAFKNILKEIYQKMIPFNMRENYLREFFYQKGEKNLFNLFKKDLNIYRNYKDKVYYLFEIFETVKYKLNNKDREEINNIFSKYNYGFYNNNNINKNFNSHNHNNNYYNDLSTKKKSGNFLNTYNYNINSNFANKNRKYSFQSQSNNCNDINYNNNINYNKNGNNNYHQHTNYSNSHNHNDNNNNDNLGFNKINDNHQNSSFHKKNSFKGSFPNWHYYNEKNKNKTYRKNSAYLVEVKTTPKKEENEENKEINIDNKDIIENKEEKKDNENNNKFINNNKKEEEDKNNKDENVVINNNSENKKEENNLLLMNEINISRDMEKEENQDNINNENDINIKTNENEVEDKLDINNNNDDYDNNFDFKLTDFNTLNPFNDKKSDENEIADDKEYSDNNLRVINTPETEKLNNNKENEDEDNNNENNSYILNIINNSETIISNTFKLDENDKNKEETNIHKEQVNDMNINSEKESEEIYNNENNYKKQNFIKDEYLLKSPPKKELIASNSANNIKERINLHDDNEQYMKENSIINTNQNHLHSISDNNIVNLNETHLNKNKININLNENSSQNNHSLSNDQLFKIFTQNNSSFNANSNSLKPNLNNNILQNANNITLNLLNNINSGMNLLNLINNPALNPNNIYYNSEIQNNINILFNYLDQEHNLLSSIKPNSKSKNNQYNKQNNIDFLKSKSEKLSNEYNNKYKKMKENNPLLVKENMDLFEEKIILPIYQKICEENQLKKELYTDIYNRYKNIIKKILEQNNLQNTQIEPYGSIVNNFMTEYGDIDICLIPEDLNTIFDFDTYLEELKEEVVNVQKCAKFIILENYGKFLILKLKDNETEIDIDITVQNILPIINTKLIRYYSLYDQRFHILGIFLKFWVKKNQIHGSLDKFLSSYALLILIIHYLQTIIEPKVLPILQQVRNKKKDYIYHNGEREILTNLYFEEDLDEIKKYMKIINNNEENGSSVVELLVGFFEYYAYKYDHYMISISRSDKIPVDENETIAFPLEDPFDIGYNPGKSMKLNTLQYNAFIYCMKKELNNIISGEYFTYGNGE